MKLSGLAIVVATLSSSAAFAQDPAAPEPAAPVAAPEAAPTTTSTGGMIAGADVGIALPVGDLADGAGLGIAALGRFEYNVAPKINLTGRLGYIHHLDKNNVTLSDIPVYAGVKYFLSEQLYGAGELGLNSVKAKVEILGTSASNSESNIGAGFGAGYLMDKIDLRAGVNIYDLGEAGKSMTLLVTAGYNFWSK
jgi:hypothetical protein